MTRQPYWLNGTSSSDEKHQQRYWRSSVIIRSGLIKNHDTVDFGEFSRHWKDIHGPLARMVPRMKAYSQNHIKKTLASGEQFGLHRVDGISQLRFDTVADMAAGMDSPEQHACIVDIQGFLSDVTILIQEEGELNQSGHSTPNGIKLMYLLGGDDSAFKQLLDALPNILAAGGSFRLHRIINRDFRVDSTVPAGNQMVDGVLEVFLAGDATAGSFNKAAAIESAPGIDVIGAFEVEEYVVLSLQEGTTT
jgi:uncharacterized protein (TIGR02118 family)